MAEKQDEESRRREEQMERDRREKERRTNKNTRWMLEEIERRERGETPRAHRK